ncbi:MAG: BLUF domain-containing protein [Gammaproteobacteria bacterium]|nr:MAG: BLUF domain-containing protein [Gammaproteobacteria bacterium]
MICMVYISSAILGLNDRQIANIVRTSQINNEQLGITGILLYNNGNFMQLIEGEEEKVEALYEKVRGDRRHTGVTLLLKEPITHKNFDNWVMGYRNIDNLKKIEPELLSPFLDEDLNFSIYKKNPYRALQFLEMFKKIIS